MGEMVFRDCSSLTSITIPEGVTGIGEAAFWGCRHLTNIIIPEGVTSIGDYAFSGCSSLTSITIPENVTSIGNGAFRECSSLTSITIPEGITSIGDYAFSGCSSMTSIMIPVYVTSIGYQAFSSCILLTDVYYSGTESEWNSISIRQDNTDLTNAVIHYNYVYLSASGQFGDGLTWSRYSDGRLVISGNGTMPDFVDANSAPWDKYSGIRTSVVIEEGVLNVSAGAFDGFTDLTSVVIADSVESIGDYAFSSCERLTDVKMGTGIETIGEAAFFGCTGLTSINIPISVTVIADDAFGACDQLTEVSYCGTEEEWSSISIGNGNDPIVNAAVVFGHDFSEWQVVADPTCTESGTDTRTCSRCGRVETRVIEALGHDLQRHEGRAATCMEIGWEAYDTCSRCDYSTYEEIAALGHDLQHHEGKAATCTETGCEAYDTCSRCDYTTYVEIEALGHDLEHHEAKAPTCTEIGWEAYDTCSRCDYTTYVEIEALGHDLQHHEGKAPTCTEIGWEVYDTCSRCDYTTYAEILAIGHDWSEPVFTWSADYQVATASMTCSRNAAHTESKNAEITIADGTGADAGYMVFTATVLFDGETFTDIQKVFCTPKYSATVTMNENFNLNLYVREIPAELASWFTVKWTFDGKSYEKNLGELTPQTGGQYPGSFKVMLAAVFSYEMTKPFDIKVYRQGTEAPIKEINYSVQTYFLNQYNKTSDALFKKIYGAALDYGASAQLYFDGQTNPSTGQPYDTDVENLANKTTNPSFTVNATKPTNKASKSIGITGMGDKMTATLIFGSETSIKIYFTYSGDINGMSITADNGKTVTAPKLESDGRYSVKIEGIRSFELYKDYTFTFRVGTQTSTLTYSPYAYAAGKWDSSNSDLARLVKALVAYGELARQKWQ